MGQQSTLTKITQYSHGWRAKTDGWLHQLQHSYGNDSNEDMKQIDRREPTMLKQLIH